MSEKIEIYDLKDSLLGVEDRDKFYSEIKKEFAKTKKITRQVKRSVLLLMNSKGKIVIQKRNKTKQENPGLYDKTLGGHVIEEDSFNLTIIKECAEKLGFPASIIPASEFERAIKKTNLRVVGIFKEIDYISNHLSKRVTHRGDYFIQPYINTTYIGYYDGSMQFIDGESSGIELFLLDELEDEIKNYPEKFTDDIKFMVKKYEKYLKPIK